SPAPMNMPDFEDASPTHFLPDATPSNVPVGVFAALQNAKEIFAGSWTGKPYEVVKKGKTRAYNITKPPAQWPTRFGRPPGLHINYDHVIVDDRPAPATIVVTRFGHSIITIRSRMRAAASTSTSPSCKRPK